MNRWERYYNYDRIHGFAEQEPYYAYCLGGFASDIVKLSDPDLPFKVVLGGIHPGATKPGQFIDLCRSIFPDRRLEPIVVDQNEAAFAGLTETGFLPVLAQIENLSPDIFSETTLMVADFTLDFMTDDQIRQLNQTLPSRLQKNGIFVATTRETALPLLRRIQGLRQYGVDTHFRNPDRLIKLLPNFKVILVALCDNRSQMIFFTRKDFPTEEFQGTPIVLDTNNGSFSQWFNARKTS